MLYGLLLSIYVFISLLLVLIILIQKGKSSLGLGSLGGGSQMLFGGSGGQDLFQKITWVFVAIFLFGSLILALMKNKQRSTFKYATTTQQAPLKPLTDHSSTINNTKQVTIPVGKKAEAQESNINDLAPEASVE
jgi:protein translocase, SecG subunit